MIKRILALGIGVIIALVASELGLRSLRLTPTRGLTTVTQREYMRLPGLLSPNLDLVVPDRVPYRVRTDSLGYRGEPLPRVKPAGERRVVMIGDSFTFGDMVADEATLPAQLEKSLRQRCGPIRVINAGVSGTTILGQDTMAERALAIQPDVVVLTYYENDLTDLLHPYWHILQRNREAKSRFPLSVVYPTLRRTALWHLALGARGRMREERYARMRSKASTDSASFDIPWDSLREHYTARLHALANSLRERQVEFVFATYPAVDGFGTSARYEKARRIIASADSAGIPTVDLLTGLQDSGKDIEELYFVPVDDHPRPEGYAVAAAQLSNTLVELPVLRSHCQKP